MTTLKPMDVYSSSPDIPFNVAAYCRGHKFAIEAIQLRHAIERRAQARLAVQVAEKMLDTRGDELRAAMVAIQQKMDRDPL